VAWSPVNEFVQPLLDQVGSWPMVGTPAWCELPADHPVKIAAIYDAAQHHALRVEANQAGLAQASRDITASADWSAVARANLQRTQAITSGACIPREAS
jgi:hypothetical protein